MRESSRLKPAAALLAATTFLGTGSLAASTPNASAADSAGALTVLVSAGPAATWNGLDPTSTTAAANRDYMNALYGQLFESGPNGTILPDLATGYTLSHGNRVVSIHLRKGVTFTDGTPFNAAAVVYNIKRDLLPSTACICASNFSTVSSVSASGTNTVVLHLKQPFAPIISAFVDAAPNWIASPTAIQRLGKDYGEKPVGAGPFQVASNADSTKLVFHRNPGYWQPNRPLLNSLTFETAGSDQSAMEGLQAGNAQVVEEMTTLQTISQAKASYDVIGLPATQTYDIQLNTKTAPFNNLKAREAIYYATDAPAIQKNLFDGLYIVNQAPVGPAGKYSQLKVPGYRTYNLAKAKQLVKQLGGLKVDLLTGAQGNQIVQVEALQSEWKAAGISTTLEPPLQLAALVQDFQTSHWQAALQFVGALDPGAGLPIRFASNGSFSGVHDPALDKLMTRAAVTFNDSKRKQLYHEIFKRISSRAYAPMLYSTPNFVVSNRSVTGITGTRVDIPWELVNTK